MEGGIWDIQADINDPKGLDTDTNMYLPVYTLWQMLSAWTGRYSRWRNIYKEPKFANAQR